MPRALPGSGQDGADTYGRLFFFLVPGSVDGVNTEGVVATRTEAASGFTVDYRVLVLG